MNNNITELQRLRKKLLDQVSWVDRRIEAAGNYGEDVYRGGAVLAFEKTFHGTETYNYAAVKGSDGFWRMSRPSGPAWTWEELTNWLAFGSPVKLWHAVEYEIVGK